MGHNSILFFCQLELAEEVLIEARKKKEESASMEMGVLKKARKKKVVTTALKEERRRLFWQTYLGWIFWLVMRKKTNHQEVAINCNLAELGPKLIEAGFKGGACLATVYGVSVSYNKYLRLLSLTYERAGVEIANTSDGQESSDGIPSEVHWDFNFTRMIEGKIMAQKIAPARITFQVILEVKDGVLCFNSTRA